MLLLIEPQIQIVPNAITGHRFQIAILIQESVEPKHRDTEMKKILMLILLLVSTNVFAGYWSGNDLYKWMKYDDKILTRKNYIAGVVDTMTSLGMSVCIDQGTTTDQIELITSNYMQKHPEHWTNEGSYFVILAIQEAYPCKKL
jgi:hypothetical protein